MAGYRSFKELRLVGYEDQGHLWRVTIESAVQLFCRPEQRRIKGPGSSSAFRHCEALYYRAIG